MIDPLELIGHSKQGNPFTIRHAQENDRLAILANIEAVCAEEIYLSTDSYLSTSDWQHVLANPSRNSAGYLLIIAQVKKEIIGHLRVFPALPGSKCRHVGDIGIALISAWRGQGIGTTMLEYSIAWAREVGYKKIIASTMHTNLSALKIFEKTGFSREGIRKSQFFVRGIYIDEVLLGLLLEPISSKNTEN